MRILSNLNLQLLGQYNPVEFRLPLIICHTRERDRERVILSLKTTTKTDSYAESSVVILFYIL